MARLRQSEKIAALQKLPLFDGLSTKEFTAIAGLTTEVRVPQGRVLAKQGDLGREAMIIESGTAEVRREGQMIAELGPGDFFGEMSLINHVPRNADVAATSDMTVLVMDSREFSSVLDSNPKVAVKILKTVVARLVENQESTV